LEQTLKRDNTSKSVRETSSYGEWGVSLGQKESEEKKKCEGLGKKLFKRATNKEDLGKLKELGLADFSIFFQTGVPAADIRKGNKPT